MFVLAVELLPLLLLGPCQQRDAVHTLLFLLHGINQGQPPPCFAGVVPVLLSHLWKGSQQFIAVARLTTTPPSPHAQQCYSRSSSQASSVRSAWLAFSCLRSSAAASRRSFSFSRLALSM